MICRFLLETMSISYGRTSIQTRTPHGKRWKALGSNSDIVTVRGWTDEVLMLENRRGCSGLVPWVRLTDPVTRRIRLGFGHAMTIDAAQGVTSDEHINAMPRGSATMTGFTAYVAESRHVHRCWTVVAEGALRESVAWSRQLGDSRPVDLDDLYDRLAADMSRHPYKSLAVDLVRAQMEHDRTTVQWIQQNHINEHARQQGKTPGARARHWLDERLLREIPRDQWDNVSRSLRKSGYAVQAAMDAIRKTGSKLRKQSEATEKKPDTVQKNNPFSAQEHAQAPSMDG